MPRSRRASQAYAGEVNQGTSPPDPVSEELEPDTTSLMWAPNIEALSREYRTVAVDQMGEFGKSVCAKPIRTLQDLIAWRDELIGTLAARTRVSLVGMSYGGALATQYALHFPERLEKVVLLAPGATVLRPPAEFWVRLMGPGIARQKGLRAFFRWVFADMARTDPQWVESAIEQLSLNMRSIQRHKIPIPPVSTDTEWRSLRIPTLFLAGENEVIYSAEKAVRRFCAAEKWRPGFNGRAKIRSRSKIGTPACAWWNPARWRTFPTACGRGSLCRCEPTCDCLARSFRSR